MTWQAMGGEFVGILREYLSEQSSEFFAIDRHALASLDGDVSVRLLVPCVIAGIAKADPGRSLLQLGSEFQCDPQEARLLLSGQLARDSGLRPAVRISCTQPAVLPSDPWVSSEHLFVEHDGLLWATTLANAGMAAIERVVALSEGYPPGVIAVHVGEPWTADSAISYAVSLFDGETFAHWLV